MGIDVSVSLLVCVDYEDVVTEICSKENITKYNCDTGKPYTVQKEKCCYQIGDELFSDEWEAYKRIENIGLSVYEEDGEPVLVGQTVIDVYKDYDIANGFSDDISIDDIQEEIADVNEKLAKLGLSLTPVIKVFSDVSC